MGIKEGALALADELEAFEDGDCEECIAYGQPECKGHLSCAEIIARYFARKVRESVERDAEDVTTVSAYDLLPEDERKAIAWVREHGGLDMAASRFESGEIAADMLWGKGHGRFWTTDEFEEEISKRLMPEGMEWPTDAIGVRIMPKETVWANGNDGGDGRAWYVESVSPGMSYSIHASDGAGNHRDLKPRWLTHEPPALKVLDAGGVEIRKGDTVWHAEDGREGTVKQIVRAHDAQWNDAACVCVAFNGSSRDDYILPANLTHRAPVLAADGEPLEAGQTVWNVNNGMEFTVSRLPNPGEYQSVEVRYRNGSSTSFDPDQLTHQRPVLDADGVPIREGDTVYVLGFGEPLTVKDFTDDGRVLMSFHDENSLGYKPSKLTHERPESWERLEEDAGKNPFDYCKDVGHRLDTCENAERFKARDIVRRAKALAERERSE